MDSSPAPEPNGEVVQMSREDYDLLLAQVNAIAAGPASTFAQGTGSLPSAVKPSFTKPGLARQFDFNSSVLSALTPLLDYAPDEGGVRGSLQRAVTLLTQRNELLTVADSDPEVFEFYDQQVKAESMQVSNPILAAFIREKKKKKEDKKPSTTRSAAWRARYLPYPQAKPFRFGGAARAPAPPSFEAPSYIQGGSSQSRSGPQPQRRPRDMCYSCGRFGHYARECRGEPKAQ